MISINKHLMNLNGYKVLNIMLNGGENMLNTDTNYHNIINESTKIIFDKINAYLFNNVDPALNEILSFNTSSTFEPLKDYCIDNNIISQENFDSSKFYNITTTEQLSSSDFINNTMYNSLTNPITLNPSYLITDDDEQIYFVIIPRNIDSVTTTNKFYNPEQERIIEQISYLALTVGNTDDSDIKLDYIDKIDIIDELRFGLKQSNIIN